MLHEKNTIESGLELNKEQKIKQNAPKRGIMKLKKIFDMIDLKGKGCKDYSDSRR
jgi:hypothetical protein